MSNNLIALIVKYWCSDRVILLSLAGTFCSRYNLYQIQVTVLIRLKVMHELKGFPDHNFCCLNNKPPAHKLPPPLSIIRRINVPGLHWYLLMTSNSILLDLIQATFIWSRSQHSGIDSEFWQHLQCSIKVAICNWVTLAFWWCLSPYCWMTSPKQFHVDIKQCRGEQQVLKQPTLTFIRAWELPPRDYWLEPLIEVGLGIVVTLCPQLPMTQKDTIPWLMEFLKI